MTLSFSDTLIVRVTYLLFDSCLDFNVIGRQQLRSLPKRCLGLYRYVYI